MATYKNVSEKRTYEYFTDKDMVLTGVNWTKSNGSTSNANEVYLDKVSSSGGSQIDNPNIYYDGGAGTDKLTYNGSKGVTVSVWGDEAGEDAFYGKDYDLYFLGGEEKDTSWGKIGIDKLEVWTVNVENFNLTSKGDTVDLSGLRAGVNTTWVAEGGDDVLYGSDNNEKFYGGDDSDWMRGGGGDDYLDGGADADTIYGQSGNDSVIGGSGDDLLYGGGNDDDIYGGSGNDTIYGGSGADTVDGGSGNDIINGVDGNDILDGGTGDNHVAGGAGHDIIYTTTNLTSGDQNQLAGDMTVITDDKGVASFVTATDYNESDVFVIGYETTGVRQGDSEFNDFFASEGGTAAIGAGANLLATAVGAGWAGPLVGFGITSMIGAIRGGSAAKSLYAEIDSIEPQVTVADFDAWADTVVVALDSHSAMVTGGAATNADAQPQLGIDMQGSTFLSLVGDQATASAKEGAFEDASYTISLSNDEMKSILQNTYNNAVRVWTTNGVLSAKTLNGVDLLLDDDASVLLDLADDIGDNEGVLLLGNVGGATIYGNNLSAVAGSISDDVIYAGTYDPDDYGAAFSSNSNINAYAGAGSDKVFGSTQSGDRLFGGSGDDYLHIGGTAGEEIDKIFGGDDFDVAGFGNISGVTNRTSGITVDLGTTKTATADYVGAKYATATWTASGAIAAELYDVEGIDGTNAADTITGSGQANILWGNGGADTLNGMGGADTISGGAGDDIITGGSGNDTFVFGTADGNDNITDLSTGDSITLTGGANDSYSLSSGTGGTTISYQDTSIFLVDLEMTTNDFSIEQDGHDLRLTVGTSGTGNNGDTVICTYINARGYIPDAVYAWDAIYGARLGEDVLRGYHAWAIPLVENVLKKSEIATQIVRPLACAWAREMAHRCAPAAHPRGSVLGRVLLATGVPICRGFGRLLARRTPAPRYVGS